MLSTTDNILTGEHMGSEHIGVSELERKVIITLAEKGPMSGYDFHLGGKRKRGHREALMSSSYWLKVLAHLGPNGLSFIKLVKLPRYYSTDKRGRRKDLYWLTEKGLLFALNYDVNTKWLLKNIERVYPDIPLLCFIVEMKEVLGERAFNYASSEALRLEDYSEESFHRLLMTLILHGFMKARELSPKSDPYALKKRIDNIIRKYPNALKLQKTIKKIAKRELDIYLSD